MGTETPPSWGQASGGWVSHAAAMPARRAAAAAAATLALEPDGFMSGA
ncbi:MAG TPA: hypothetical protein VFY88_03985 [Intrasporangium sp.]|nr:hypothetical protein [Intrasporangium sp.]